MQTLRDFRLKLEQGGRVVGEPWLQRLCRQGDIPGAQLFAGRVWMLPDDAKMPEPRKMGRKPWKHLDQLPGAGQAAEDTVRMQAGFCEVLELTRKVVEP